MRYRTADTDYSPLYYLAALGAGGLTVSFFMYLMWLTPHPGSPIPTFDTLQPLLLDGSWGMRGLAGGALAGVAMFAVWHVRLLIWNLRAHRAWSRTPAAAALRAGNAETQLMAVPLTLAMSVNVALIVGALFVPGLWELRELLFPVALTTLAAIGVYALRIYLRFQARVLVDGGYDCARNNNLGQMISVFALSMIAVGFAAPAAMSQDIVVVTLGFAGAVLFLAAAGVLGGIKLVLGFKAMMENRADAETTPTLWIMIPILTVAGIALYRLRMALAHTYDVPWPAGETFAFLLTLFAIQMVFLLLGSAVMLRAGYWQRWILGPERSAGSYTLICPGVALFVFANFLLNAGLVGVDVIAPGSLAHTLMHLPLVILQAATIALFVHLDRKLLQKAEPDARETTAVAAERRTATH